MNGLEPVARETFTLLQSHFDLLWKVAGTALTGSGGVIVFLFLRLMKVTTEAIQVQRDLKEVIEDLREDIRAQRKE